MPTLSRTPPVVAYDIKAILRPLPGRSYLGFICGSCDRPIAMLQDVGVPPSRSLDGSTFEVRCPSCTTMAAYDTAALHPFTAG